MQNRTKSEALFSEALKYIPGGVNSPVRAFRAVGGNPFFVWKAAGPRIYDIDGNEYIDYVCTWGPAILGHANPVIINAVREAAANGTSFGIPNPLEVEMAKSICEAVPSVKKVRMCNSGTEATMSAIRLARGFTKRNKIIKFEGCYHGHVDSLLVSAGSGALTFGTPDSEGIPHDFIKHTLVLPFNDVVMLKDCFNEYKNDIAAVILEPVPGNSGVYLPKLEFLKTLKDLCSKNGTVLIFDEVMTGFRLSFGGAQSIYGIEPDLTCFGKIIGGGLPVGAFGGRKDIMDMLAPTGPVYQAGTLSGNPLAMAAGLAALKELKMSNTYEYLEMLGQTLETGLKKAAASAKVDVTINRKGSMLCVYFSSQPVSNLKEAMGSDRTKFARFFNLMLENGVFIPPSQFESWFISSAHTPEDVETTITAASKAFKKI
jgi:glutamate-1-semialdehyde 2,1-aminomutase